MTRIFLPLLLFLIPFTSYGQYQLPNPGFENWESNGEPTGFTRSILFQDLLPAQPLPKTNYPNKVKPVPGAQDQSRLVYLLAMLCSALLLTAILQQDKLSPGQ